MSQTSLIVAVAEQAGCRRTLHLLRGIVIGGFSVFRAQTAGCVVNSHVVEHALSSLSQLFVVSCSPVSVQPLYPPLFQRLCAYSEVCGTVRYNLKCNQFPIVGAVVRGQGGVER